MYVCLWIILPASETNVDGDFHAHLEDMSCISGGVEIWGTDAEVLAAAYLYNTCSWQPET